MSQKRPLSSEGTKVVTWHNDVLDGALRPKTYQPVDDGALGHPIGKPWQLRLKMRQFQQICAVRKRPDVPINGKVIHQSKVQAVKRAKFLEREVHGCNLNKTKHDELAKQQKQDDEFEKAIKELSSNPSGGGD